MWVRIPPSPHYFLSFSFLFYFFFKANKLRNNYVMMQICVLGPNELISCGCVLLFTSISVKCDYGSDGVSTQSKLNGHTYKCYRVMYRSIFLL